MAVGRGADHDLAAGGSVLHGVVEQILQHFGQTAPVDRESTRLNSSHLGISYAVFCLKKKRSSTGPRVQSPSCRLQLAQRLVGAPALAVLGEDAPWPAGGGHNDVYEELQSI